MRTRDVCPVASVETSQEHTLILGRSDQNDSRCSIEHSIRRCRSQYRCSPLITAALLSSGQVQRELPRALPLHHSAQDLASARHRRQRRLLDGEKKAAISSCWMRLPERHVSSSSGRLTGLLVFAGGGREGLDGHRPAERGVRRCDGGLCIRCEPSHCSRFAADIVRVCPRVLSAPSWPAEVFGVPDRHQLLPALPGRHELRPRRPDADDVLLPQQRRLRRLQARRHPLQGHGDRPARLPLQRTRRPPGSRHGQRVGIARAGRGRCGDPTTWTALQQDGPNHLGLWCNALPGHQKQPVSSRVVCAPAGLALAIATAFMLGPDQVFSAKPLGLSDDASKPSMLRHLVLVGECGR